MTVLIDAPRLAESLAGPHPPTVLDVRWSLRGGGRAEYDRGHLPGAIFADLDTGLCGPPGDGGRHPLPDPAALQESLRGLGLREGAPVIVYDAGGPDPTGAAARAWWTLRWAGIADVRVLDGGYAAWTGPVSTSPPTQPPGDVVVRPGAMPVWDAADAAAAEGLVDARVPERYSGATEPVDAVAGHIPGARNVPVRSTVDVSGRLRPADELRELLAGARGAYCGSGVTAAQLVLAMHHAGLGDPALYVGSWSHWITDPGRPIAKGDQP